MKIVIILIISCVKSNCPNNNVFKNKIDYYIINLNKLDESTIPYVIEKAEYGNLRALFLYIHLLKIYPNNDLLNSRIKLLKNIDNLIEYLYNNNNFFELGYLYFYGVEEQLEPNIEKAIEHYNKAINLGNADAANKLGTLYQYGVLYQSGLLYQLETNIDKAITYYNKAVEMGNSDAAYTLGHLYQYGIPGQLEPDIDRAIECYNKILKLGDSSCLVLSLELLYKNLINEKLHIGINEGLKCAFDLYNRYKYEHSIISEIFILNNDTKNFNDSKDYEDNIEIYENNIKECYGIILEHKIVNDSNSTVSSFIHNPINNDLFSSYEYVCNYLESLLDLIPYLNKYSFMINCIKLRDRTKLNNEGDYVNIIDIDGNEYICLGDYEIYKRLLNIINSKDLLLDNINKILNNIDNTYLSKALKEVIKIEQQLYDIIISTSSIRNFGFLSKYNELFSNN